MKTALCIIALFVFGNLNAQKTIGKIAPMGAFVAELSYMVSGSDTVYTFTFNDKKYTQIDAIKSVSFTSLNEFYTNLKSVFIKKSKDYSLDFTLGKEPATVKAFKSMGILQAMIYVKDGYTTLTEKQVDKLFGN
jgi:hypothetical protein